MDVLKQSGALDPKVPLAATPVSGASGEQIMAPYSYVGRAIGYLGDRLEEASIPFQEAAGAQAVDQDANGNIRVNWRWLELTKGDKAYNAAARAAGIARYRVDISNDLQEMHLRNQGNPAGFEAESKAYIKNIGKSDPLLRPFVQEEAAGVAGQHYRGLIADKERVDTQRFAKDLDAREGYLTDQLESLAEQGGVNTPEFIAKRDELIDLRKERAANPKFTYSPQQADIDNTRSSEQLKALAIVGKYRREYLESGDLAGTLRKAEEDLNSAQLNLPPAERSKYLGAITARTQAAAAVRAETIRQASDRADLLVTALNAEDKVDPRSVDDTLAELRQYRQYSKIAQIETARVVNEIAPVLRYGTAAEKAAAMTRLRGQSAAGTTDREAYYRAIGGAESGNSPNAKNPDSSATGLFQFTAGTWDGLRRDHPELGLTADGRTDADQQHRAIKVFTEENEAKLRQIGAEPNAQNLYTAHFLGGQGAQRFLNGLRANPDAPASSYVDPDAVAANRSIFYTDGGRGRARTAEEVYALLGRKVGGGGASGPVYAAAVKQLQAKFDGEVTTAWGKVTAAWDKGVQPTPDEIQTVASLAPLLSDPKKIDEIKERLGREEFLQKLDGESAVVIRAAVDQLKRSAEAGELPPAERALTEGLAKREEMLTKRLREDPLSLANTAGPLAGEMGTGLREAAGSLRFDNAEVLGAQLQQRAMALRVISNFHGEPLGSVLRPDDVPQVRQILQNGDGNTVSAFFGAIGGLDDQALFATLSDKRLSQTIEGLAKTTDYGKYTAAMSGMDQLLRRNPDLFVQSFGKDAVAQVQGWQARLAWETPDEGTKRLAKRADGITGKIQDEMRAEARSYAKDKGDQAAVSALGVDAAARPSFIADYRQLVEDANVETADPEAAHKAAMTTLETIWKKSPTNGNRVMKHAPEQYYPTIDGSHGWMAQQVQETLKARVGARDEDVLDGLTGETIKVRPTVPYTLVSTPETQADIAAKRPPRYRVVFTNPTTGRLEEFDARFNVEKAMEPVRDRQAGEVAQEQSNRARRAKDKSVRDLTDPVGLGLIDPVNPTSGQPAEGGDSRPFDDSPHGLNILQRSFLGTLDLAEKAGAGGTALKLYNDIVQRGRTAPVTENDLTGAEQDELRQLIENHVEKTGKKSGKIDYKDYAGYSFDNNILGGFLYTIKDGKISIDDTYDFNVDRADAHENNVFVQALAAIANPRGLAAGIGRKIVPDGADKGVPVRITLNTRKS